MTGPTKDLKEEQKETKEERKDEGKDVKKEERSERFDRGERRPFRGGGRRGGVHNDRRGGGRDNYHTNRRGYNNDQHSFRGDNSMQSEENDEIAEKPATEKKFTGRSRLFVGNLPGDTSEDDFRDMFKPYGELSEVYINTQRGFAFVRLDTRSNAESAKNALDGLQKKGRFLRVRFASHGAALKVKHLPPFTSNELLEQAFAQFGTVERAVVVVDDRGKPTGDGIVEFARKPGAQAALQRINNGVFLLGGSPRPVLVEPLEQKDEDDGLSEKFIQKTQGFHTEREQPPRFAKPGSFEHDYAQKWRELYRMADEQKEQLQRQMEEAQNKLEMEMVQAQLEHQAAMLRQDYMRKQEELKRMEEMHQAEIQRRMEMRQREDDMRRQNEDRRRQEMVARQQQEEELRRRQMEERRGSGGPNEMFGTGPSRQREMRERNAPMQPPPAPPAGLGIEGPRGGRGMGPEEGMQGQGQGMGGNMPMRQTRFDQPPQNMGGGGGFNNMGGGNMGGPGNMTGNGHMGNQGMNMGGRGGPMGNERGMAINRSMSGERMGNERMMERQMDRQMDRRAERGNEERFFENKRPRRY